MADIKKMKMQLAGAVLSVMVSAVALTSATYAWYVSNTTVEGTTSTISAKANNFVLQIGLLENGAQHGDNSQSLQAETLGGKITPSSTQNIKDWYVCDEWKTDGLVHGATIATNVGYNGIAMRVYIWLEGTEADCINANGKKDDMSTYNVTVNLAGVAS